MKLDPSSFVWVAVSMIATGASAAGPVQPPAPASPRYTCTLQNNPDYAYPKSINLKLVNDGQTVIYSIGNVDNYGACVSDVPTSGIPANGPLKFFADEGDFGQCHDVTVDAKAIEAGKTKDIQVDLLPYARYSCEKQ